MKMTRTIEFDKDLYSKPAINRAISDFQDFADASITERENLYEVALNIKRGGKDQVAKEFSNYVLGMTKEMC